MSAEGGNIMESQPQVTTRSPKYILGIVLIVLGFVSSMTSGDIGGAEGLGANLFTLLMLGTGAYLWYTS
jgi:hypothetical protein